MERAETIEPEQSTTKTIDAARREVTPAKEAGPAPPDAMRREDGSAPDCGAGGVTAGGAPAAGTGNSEDSAINDLTTSETDGRDDTSTVVGVGGGFGATGRGDDGPVSDNSTEGGSRVGGRTIVHVASAIKESSAA